VHRASWSGESSSALVLRGDLRRKAQLHRSEFAGQISELFAQSLVTGDVVALEARAGADKIVSILQAHGVRVVVANTRKLRSITEAKAKTNRLDAKTLARLLMSGLLDEVWTPDERTRTLRRLTNRRERVVRARTRATNEAHGVLSRNLCERPPVTDAFGKAGRRWLAAQQLPVH
jgi:transposase